MRFRSNWSSYQSLRERMLIAAGSHGVAGVHEVDSELGRKEFDAAEQTLDQAREAFHLEQSNNLQEISRSIQRFLTGAFAVLWLKIAVLVLLIWIDWKRRHALKQLEETSGDLKASEERFRRTYEAAGVGMGIFTIDGTVLSVNEKAAQILGYEKEELIGTKVSRIMAPEHVEDHLQKLATTPMTEEGGYRAERRVLRKDGREVWVRNTVTLLREEGLEPYYFATSEEITEQHKANERLAYLANYDPVTNLANRRYFEEQLTSALTNRRRGECVALLYLEIDGFDFLKGTFGRSVADELLGAVGKCLYGFRKDGEVIGRVDDHAFALMMVAASYDEATMQRARELQDAIRNVNYDESNTAPLSASVGIAFSDEAISTLTGVNGDKESITESLLKFARAAMLEARSRGGDSICVADPHLRDRAAQRHQIESALLRGIRENEFRVVFQPQFHISDGRLVRFEALCRWNSGELGMVPPDRFIPIAEQTGLIAEIGRRVLISALQEAKSWLQNGRRIGLAVNISPMQFMRPDFPQSVAEALAEAGFAPELLELEITEGIFIRDLNLAIARIRELQRLGLSIALDDFGTGYSSLSYLQRMPIDAVKLDRSFVSDLSIDSATVSMVQSVLAMARALKLRVVTEGVETTEQLSILRELGCDEAQGYLLGRPESAEMALQRVLNSPSETTKPEAQLQRTF
ncbi:putative bifunctional diguanylate cyclase/phosphodiesterase [Acidicapsa dinghuensis]|uniref:Bifunctional diguanylate cyclase/phosphodiesterase n=2 Tax=Acidicapsa dinghuensis TaxID=2218256 RepID=A0ABW1ED28_9BACT|nr:EAL domain-containing protein [Acidicapsa dinghuensis]